MPYFPLLEFPPNTNLINHQVTPQENLVITIFIIKLFWVQQIIDPYSPRFPFTRPFALPFRHHSFPRGGRTRTLPFMSRDPNILNIAVPAYSKLFCILSGNNSLVPLHPGLGNLTCRFLRNITIRLDVPHLLTASTRPLGACEHVMSRFVAEGASADLSLFGARFTAHIAWGLKRR